MTTWWICPQCDTVWREIDEESGPSPGYAECRRIAIEGEHYAVCSDCEIEIENDAGMAGECPGGCQVSEGMVRRENK
jgi:hypothetical protein